MTIGQARAVGIWRFADLYDPPVEPRFQVTLGEGGTPLVSVPPLAERLGVATLLLKRDDLSPGGSHKSRSLAYRVSLARQRGEVNLCLSSSGNAAVAASLYSARAGLRLFAFVSPETPAVKRDALRRPGTVLIESTRPRNLARYASRLFGMANLTPSLDDASIEGFKSIAAEVVCEAGIPVNALFSFVTSGSSLVGMARVLQATSTATGVHPVQAGVNARVAGGSDPRWQAERAEDRAHVSRLAGLLAVEETPRSAEAIARTGQSGGRGWVQHDEEILEARGWLAALGIDTSPEGAACVSAVARARREGTLVPGSRVVVVLTGHGSQWPVDPREPAAPESIGFAHRVDGYAELRGLLATWLSEVPRSER